MSKQKTFVVAKNARNNWVVFETTDLLGDYPTIRRQVDTALQNLNAGLNAYGCIAETPEEAIQEAVDLGIDLSYEPWNL